MNTPLHIDIERGSQIVIPLVRSYNVIEVSCEASSDDFNVKVKLIAVEER